jgi:hypothetical protein
MAADYGTPTHYVLSADRSSNLILYKNGNSVASVSIAASSTVDIGASNTTVGVIGSQASGYSVLGTFYRFRTWNKALSQAEVTASFENSTVPFADQYGSQTTINSGTTTSGLRYRITARDGVDFTTIGAAANTVGTEFVATGSVTLDANDTVARIGCVSDYDLSYAQPEISTIVQNRSGSGDGTSSASGVTQVTPIEQLNTKSLSVGTVAATPADGELLVSGAIKLQNDTANLRVQSNTTPTKGASLSYDHAGSFGQLLVDEQGVNQLAMKYYALSHTFGRSDGLQYATIDSAGLATFSAGIAVTTGGVAFPATQSASADANTLDDYEEGEWSPTVTCSTSGSYALHTGFDKCAYTKVGRLLSVQGKLYITGETGTPSGDIRISLPITSLGGLSDDSEYVVGSVDINSHGGTMDNVQANVGAAFAYMWLTSTAEDGTASTLTHADVDTSFWITFNFTYLA